jgi:dynein heavy chain, axonemal
LFFEGCGWDPRDKKLIENRGREIVTPAPMILILPTKDKKKNNSEFTCPVYKTMERKGVLSSTGHSTNFILHIDVFTDVDPRIWVKRGVAMICQLTD